MAAPKFYEGQEFHNPNDPSAPVLVYRGGKFLPKDASGAIMGGVGGKQSPVDQKQVAALQTAADSLDNAAGLTSDFMARNSRVKTGGVFALPLVGSAAKALGVGGDDLAAMDRDSTSLATSLRSPGQRLTQMEFLQNLRAGPSIKNAEPDNAQAAQGVYNANTMAQAKASFFSSYLAHHGDLAAVVPAWQAFKSQHFAPDGSYSHEPLTNQQAAGQALKAKSAGKVLNPQDYLQ